MYFLSRTRTICATKHGTPLEQPRALYLLTLGRTYLCNETRNSAGATQICIFVYLQTFCSDGARIGIVFSVANQNYLCNETRNSVGTTTRIVFSDIRQNLSVQRNTELRWSNSGWYICVSTDILLRWSKDSIVFSVANQNYLCNEIRNSVGTTTRIVFSDIRQNLSVQRNTELRWNNHAHCIFCR